MSVTRVRAGAPNEERFGFAQAVRSGPVTWVAGQVGKNNVTGEMVGSPTFGARLGRALDNVCDSLRGAGASAHDAVALQIHVARGVPVDPAVVAGACAVRFGTDRPAITLVTLAGLSHAEYLVEVSATAVTKEPGMSRTAVPGAGPVERRLGVPAAVRVGPYVHVGGQHGHGDGVGSALADAIGRFGAALTDAGASLAHVVSHHLYVVGPVDADGFAALCDVHRGAFGAAPPAATLVLVDALPDPGARVLLAGTAFVHT